MVAWEIPKGRGVIEIRGIPSVIPSSSSYDFNSEKGVYEFHYSVNEEFADNWFRERVIKYEQKPEKLPSEAVKKGGGWEVVLD